MRSILLATALVTGGASAAMAQESYSGDAALNYFWVRTNAAPGQCGCFGLNGGGLSGSWLFRGPWSAVTEISAEYTGSAPSTGNSLTLTSFWPVRATIFRNPGYTERHKPQTFAQLLVGAAHAGGGVAGIADASYGFATRIGGGIDVPVNSRFAVRIIQIDYYLPICRTPATTTKTICWWAPASSFIGTGRNNYSVVSARDPRRHCSVSGGMEIARPRKPRIMDISAASSSSNRPTISRRIAVYMPSPDRTLLDDFQIDNCSYIVPAFRIHLSQLRAARIVAGNKMPIAQRLPGEMHPVRRQRRIEFGDHGVRRRRDRSGIPPSPHRRAHKLPTISGCCSKKVPRREHHAIRIVAGIASSAARAFRLPPCARKTARKWQTPAGCIADRPRSWPRSSWPELRGRYSDGSVSRNEFQPGRSSLNGDGMPVQVGERMDRRIFAHHDALRIVLHRGGHGDERLAVSQCLQASCPTSPCRIAPRPRQPASQRSGRAPAARW